MGEVTFVSSAGLRVILMAAKQAAAAKGGARDLRASIRRQ